MAMAAPPTSPPLVGRPLRRLALVRCCASPHTPPAVSTTLAALKRAGRVAVIPFIMAGDPALPTTAAALRALDAAGADAIELGVPYSDPLADGPVIQAAATRALAANTSLAAVLDMVAELSPSLSAPLILFTYYNPIMKKGPEAFMRALRDAGVSDLLETALGPPLRRAGLVVPDIPLEETHPLRKLASAHGLELVLLTTPTTPTDRMAQIAEATQGFLYLVSLTGVTGTRKSVESRVEQLLKDIKEKTDKPVAVGFGISTAEHAAQVAMWGADGVIVGSKMVQLLHSAETPEAGVDAIAALTHELKQAVSKHRSVNN